MQNYKSIQIKKSKNACNVLIYKYLCKI